MKSLFTLNLTPRMQGVPKTLCMAVFFLLLLFPAMAHAMPTGYENMQNGFSQLRIGGSTPGELLGIMGSPDEVVSSTQMYPVVDNYYYYDHNGSGAATVFVFENGFLVNMLLKSPNNQLMDLSFFLTNNGDRRLTTPYLGGYRSFFPYPQFFSGW